MKITVKIHFQMIFLYFPRPSTFKSFVKHLLRLECTQDLRLCVLILRQFFLCFPRKLHIVLFWLRMQMSQRERWIWLFGGLTACPTNQCINKTIIEIRFWITCAKGLREKKTTGVHWERFCQQSLGMLMSWILSHMYSWSHVNGSYIVDENRWK